jgi:peptidoglycan-N-acetylglucosamine deacetylase
MEGSDYQAMNLSNLLGQKLFPSIIFATTDKGIHLTFDDGPHPVATPNTLDILRKYGIHATFFLLGQNVQRFPDLTRQISFEGHQIGNHSFSHDSLLFKRQKDVRLEIFRTEAILETTIGKHSKGFRPPYGHFNLSTLNTIREFGLKCVLWNADSKDYKADPIEKIEARIMPNLSSGSILLFHNNERTERSLPLHLPILLDLMLEKGFIFNKLPI